MRRGRYRVWPVTGLSGSVSARAGCKRSRARKGAVEAALSTTACRIEEVIRALDRRLAPAALLGKLGRSLHDAGATSVAR